MKQRTNVGLRPEHVAKLREIAAKRGERDYANVLAEAIEAFLASQKLDDEKRRKALAMLGTLSDKRADAMLARIQKGRERPWQS